MRLRQRGHKCLQALQRLLGRFAVNHKPLLIDALPGERGDGFFLGQDILRQRLELRNIIIHPQRRETRQREQGQRDGEADGQLFMASPGGKPA